ncbi:MAG: hypothetical protein AAF641_03995 [Pseudomonadota bacterium]
MDRNSLIAQIQAEQNLERAQTLVELLKAVDDDSRNRRIFWSNPLMLAVAGGVISILGSILAGVIQHLSEIELERRKAINLLVNDAIASSADASITNLTFLAEAGLLGELGPKITKAARTHGPTNEEKAAFAVEPDTPTAVFYGSYSTIDGAKRAISQLRAADHLSEADFEIMFREDIDLFSVFLEVPSRQTARQMSSNLPTGSNTPFLRTLQDTCASIDPRPQDDPITSGALLCSSPASD